jgi:hypothetical protein
MGGSDSGDVISRLRPICAEVGFELDGAEPGLLARLRLLAECTESVSDVEHMASMARTVFRYYETTKPSEAWHDIERRIVILGCVFADIGKTGPYEADASGQRLIAEMFATENVRDDTQPVEQFLRTYFPADTAERARRFAVLGLDLHMSIREFWNLHATWTLHIVEAGGVPSEAVAAAATHHLLEDVNPDAIVGPDSTFTRSFGDNTAFDRAEKLIILLDKYDALRRRSGRTHDQAIAWLRGRVENDPRFRNDAQFASLIPDVDAALREQGV